MRTIEITVENNRTSELPTRPLSRTTRRDQTDELASSPLDCFCYGWWLCYDFDDPVPPWGCPGGGWGVLYLYLKLPWLTGRTWREPYAYEIFGESASLRIGLIP